MEHVKVLCLIWKAIKNSLQTSTAFHTYITMLSLISPGLIQSLHVLFGVKNNNERDHAEMSFQMRTISPRTDRENDRCPIVERAPT